MHTLENNISLDSIDTLLPEIEPYIEDYRYKVSLGQQYLQTKKINILSLVRNVGNVLDNNIEILKKCFQTYCLDYKFIFFENDSIDDTLSIIKKHQSNNNNIIYKSINYNRQQFGSVKHIDRIKYLAEYRNIIRDIGKYIESDFTIVIDSDFSSFSIEGLLNSFGWISINENITAIAGNSFEIKSNQLWNYDSWAYRGSWWTDFHHIKPAPFNTIDPMYWFGLWIPPVGSRPISVNSAFGGCCIYKSSIYYSQDIVYRSHDCEHVCFHYDLSQKYENFRLVLNPSQRMLFN